MLVIDSVFFFVELITGYAVGSLALVADSFHMLNDVLSLVVALYTIKLARSPSSSSNSYGWQRAEILGALINGVFLVALCMSIALEALGRVIAPPEISNPKVIVIVGSLGLLSNIVGLFLFHEHGHGHGHSHGEGAIKLPEGDDAITNGNGEVSGRRRSDSMSSLYQHPAQTRAQVIETAAEYAYGQNRDSGDFGAMSPPSGHNRSNSQPRRHARAGSGRARGTPQLTPHTEASPSASGSSATAVEEHAHSRDGHDHLAKNASDAEQGKPHSHDSDDHGHHHGSSGDDHGHSHGGHGHSHGSMNMQGVFLHVLGDALGNVGVIAAGLVIWFCEGRWTLYFDPGISLLITCIILSSAMPLVKSASYILMQAVPSHVSLDAVRDSVYDVDGVVSVHELHIWQLSESTVVASVHVLVKPGKDYMAVANGIRGALHAHGIHSVTIQPEFFREEDAASVAEEQCLIRCPPEQCGTDTCCPPVRAGSSVLLDVEDRSDPASGNDSPRR